MDFQPLPFKRLDFLLYDTQPEMPKHFDEMLRIAERLSQGFPFLRVDLYEINGRVYFSELTFISCSGWMLIEPEEWDYIIGSWLELPEHDFDIAKGFSVIVILHNELAVTEVQDV